MSKNVPKLRFPEFTEEWHEKNLEDVVNVLGGYAFKSSKFSSKKEKYQVIKMGNLYNNQLLLDRSPSYIKEISELETQFLLKKGDVILTLTGTRGKRDYGYSYRISNDNNLLLNQRLALMRSIQGKLDGEFLRYILLSEGFLGKFFLSSLGGTGNQSNVSISKMSKFSLRFPSLIEQIKISSFLSTIDSRIEVQSDKVGNLEEMKKGLMQKLFSQEIRFKREDGSEYPEWEDRTLSKVVEKKFKGSQPIYSKTGRILLNNDYLDNDASPIFVENELDVAEKDVLILWDGSQAGRAYTGFTGVLGSTLVGIRLKRDLINNIFIQKFLEFKLEIIQQTWRTGSGVPHVTKEFVERFTVPVPALLEQNKIATFLSTIDEKIEIEKDILGVLTELKKGLLQQMFV